jgi:dihydropteroate synthase
MLEAVANKSIPYIAMHMIGKPQTMQQYTQYDDLVSDVVKEVSELKDKAIKAGIKDVIVDPGFGFSKNLDQNFELLNELDRFKILSSPILVGISRKSMIYKSLHTTPDKALNGTSALHMIALERGANILRVHDVKEAVECVALHKKLKGL